MPEHEKIKRLLSGTNINYFHCLQIVDILRETEKDSKNFFGSYGSQRMKDWQEVVRLYQRENVFLAEAAQLLSQAVTYDIPGLKKQLAKSIQVQEECDKKEKDNARKSKEFKSEFDASCKQLGIQGVKIRQEIINLLSELPNTYAQIAKDNKSLKRVRSYYLDFLKSTVGNENIKEAEVLPTLEFLIHKGNVTTYEWMYGEAPLSVEELQLQFAEEDEGDDSDEGEIDFGKDLDSHTIMDDGGDIDWGNLDSGDASADIDWSASIEAAGDYVAMAEIVVEDGGISGGIARDSEALSLLDNRRTRTMILDELTELHVFLEQRLVELQQMEEGKFTLATNVVRDENADFLNESVHEIDSLEAKLNTGKIHHLQLIRGSPKYVDRLVDSLKAKLSLVDKMIILNKVVQERQDAAIQEQAIVQAKLKLIKEKAQELQKDIEQDVSKRYKNRPVNIMGGVQSV